MLGNTDTKKCEMCILNI